MIGPICYYISLISIIKLPSSLSLNIFSKEKQIVIVTTCIKPDYVFSVDDVEKAGITGLKGLQYLDKTLPDTPNLTEQREKVRRERGI